MNRIDNERGFMLLNVIFLMLITSFAAMILFNAAPRFQNPQSLLRLTAIHLANKKFALIESKATEKGELDLTDLKEDSFTVTAKKEKTLAENLYVIKVTVKVDKENFKFEEERTIRLVKK